MLILNRFGVELALDKPRDGVHGAGAVERHDGREILDGLGAHVHAHAGDARRLQLEHARGLPLPQHGEGSRISGGNGLHGKVRLPRTDVLDGVVDDRQVAKSQKVHFEQSQLLQGGHGILGDNGIVVGGQRHIVVHRQPGDDHAGSVGGGVAGHALQSLRRVDELLDPAVVLVHLLELGRDLEGFGQGDVQGHGGHQLGHHVGFGIGEVQRPPHVPDGTPGGHGAEGDNLRHVVVAILFAHVVHHLAPAGVAEVHVDIGHGDAFGVQEPLEVEAIFHGVEVCDVEGIGHHGACGAAAAGSHRNAHALGVADKVRDNEKIVGKAHFLNHFNFIFQLLAVLRVLAPVALLKALVAELLQVREGRIALGQLKFRQVVFSEGEFHVAPRRNVHGVGKGFVLVGEQLPQLLLGFHIEFVGFKFQAIGVVHGLAHLHAHEDILGAAVLPAEVVGVVGDHQGKSSLPGNAENAQIHLPLLRQAVILKLQIKVLRAEDLRKLQRRLLGGLIVASHEKLRHPSSQAGRKGDDSLVVLPEKL